MSYGDKNKTSREAQSGKESNRTRIPAKGKTHKKVNSGKESRSEDGRRKRHVGVL